MLFFLLFSHRFDKKPLLFFTLLLAWLYYQSVVNNLVGEREVITPPRAPNLNLYTTKLLTDTQSITDRAEETA